MAFKFLKIVVAILLLLALGSWPYGYYTILRVLTCATGVWAALRYYNKDQEGIAAIFGIIALLFNPLFPIHLERETWAVIDVLAAGFILYSFHIDKGIGEE